MSRRTNSWLVRCTSLLAVLALGTLPLVLAADSNVLPEGKVHVKVPALAGAESTPASNELYHNDLTPGAQVSIPGTTTTMSGDAIQLQDYGAGLEVRTVTVYAATQIDIPGRCSDSAASCTGGTQCPGQTNRCTRSGNACTTDADCPFNDGISYDYCDPCVFVDDWVLRLRLYDAYDSGASPVNSGLITEQIYNAGGVWAATNNFGWAYAFPASSLVLSDPDIFYSLEMKILPYAGSPVISNAQFDAGPWNLGGSWNYRGGGPPQRGASDTGGYIDRDGNQILDAVDRVTGYSVTGCPGGTCQANLRMFITGPRNPALVDPGAEFYTIAGNGDSYVDLALAAGTFDYDDSGFVDCTGGLGSSVDLNSHVVLWGTEIINNVTSVVAINAIFEHASFLLPGGTSYNLTAFQAQPLKGAPVIVTRDDGAGGITTEEWDLSVCRNGGANGGTETASRNACGPTATEPGQGGPITMTLNLRPKLTFVKRTDPTCIVTIDTGIPVPMVSEPFKWNDTPAPDIITVGAGIGFDKTCDGTVDTPPAVGGSSTGLWFPGTFIPRCPADLSCDPHTPVTRLFRFTGPGWGVALHEAVATVDLAEATDTDQDRILDGADDCIDVFDPDQTDSDGDGVGDACDNSAQCNPDQADTDGDGTPDVDDGCPLDPDKTAPGICGCGVADTDGDGDGVADCIDNCPLVPNADQADSNGNGIGDACDGCVDADGDGLCDVDDSCPNSILDPTVIIPPTGTVPPPPGTAPDTSLPCDSGVPNYLLADGCTLSDKIAACDAASHNKGQFDKCVKALTKQWKKDGIITEKQRKAIDKCVKKYKKRAVFSTGLPGGIGGGSDDH